MANPIPFDRLSSLRLRGGAARTPIPPLMQLMRKLWRRKVLILGTTALLVAVAAVTVFVLTPLYTAQTLVILEPEQKGAIDITAVIAGLPNDESTIESESQVLMSRGLAQKVVKQIGLDQVPEFNWTLQPPTIMSTTLDFIRHDIIGPIQRTLQSLAGIQPPPVSGDPQDAIMASVLDMFVSRLTVAPVGRSRAISIQFTSENPQLAARVANALAQLYIVERLDEKFESTRKVTEWLNTRVGDLRKDVETKQRAADDFRRKAQLFTGDKGVQLVTQEISELTTALNTAHTERVNAEAQLQQLQRLNAKGQATSADAVLANPLIQRLREQEAQNAAVVSQLQTRYAASHPKMRDALAQLSDVRKSLQAEIEKVIRSLESQVGIARDREKGLQDRMSALKIEVGKSNAQDVQLQMLDQEAQTAQTLLDTFLQRFISSDAQQDIVSRAPDARIVTFATAPLEPSFPKKIIILALALIAAGSVGVALAFVLEMMDTSFRSSDEVEAETGLGVLGHVPLLTGWRNRRLGLVNHVMRYQSSIATESIRRIATALTMAREDGAGNRILITSSQPGEGKTSLSLALARVLASAGQRILIIDADIRQAKVHSMLNLKAGPGLTDYLVAERPLEDVVHRDRHSGVHVITSGTTTVSSPQAAFGSERMKALLEKAGQAYDVVLVDSPPVSAVSDALLLARFTSVLFVVRWGGVPRNVVTSAMRQLVQTGTHLMGVVLSQVDPKRHIQYGYSDAGGYTSAVRKYYAKA